MNVRKIIGCISLTLVAWFAAVSAHAGCGSPSQPPGTPPYGLAIHGDAGGTKLTGSITVSFSNLHCSVPGSDACTYGGPDLAYATASIQLKKSGGNSDASGSSDKIKTLSAVLGDVLYNDAAAVQDRAMAAFRCPILKEFFGVSSDECDASALQIYLKEISSFDIGDNATGFSAMASLVLAVK